MTPPRAVLDACVLVPIALCDVLMELADDRLFQPLWSKTILGEVERALTDKRGLSPDRAWYRVEQMRLAQPRAAVTGFEALISGLRNHPKDRHVLAVAVHADCPVIVTENLADFPAEALRPHGVTAMRADDFLLQLLAQDETAVWEAVERKRVSYRRPPQTRRQFCDRLAATAPRFAARLGDLAVD
ncbi:MAG: PIN domain-containing protein [Propionibacteriaceae bacterium]|jgi:predicted nucleic acid-binding protein|nr:PIN domain-containing protein [Propionibacteriaceae bacterium]